MSEEELAVKSPCFWFGVTPGGAQGVLVALCSGINLSLESNDSLELNAGQPHLIIKSYIWRWGSVLEHILVVAPQAKDKSSYNSKTAAFAVKGLFWSPIFATQFHCRKRKSEHSKKLLIFNVQFLQIKADGNNSRPAGILCISENNAQFWILAVEASVLHMMVFILLCTILEDNIFGTKRY